MPTRTLSYDPRRRTDKLIQTLEEVLAWKWEEGHGRTLVESQ